MSNDDRLVEIMSDVLHELREMKTDIRSMKDDINVMKNDIHSLKDQQAKTNLTLGELRQSVMKLSDQLEKFANFEERIRKLESIVLKQAS